MKIHAMIVQDRADVWFRGQKDERTVRIVTLIDQDTDQPMPNTFDYRLSEEEAKVHPQGSLHLKQVTLSVRSITPAKGGRLVFAGVLSNGAASPALSSLKEPSGSKAPSVAK